VDADVIMQTRDTGRVVLFCLSNMTKRMDIYEAQSEVESNKTTSSRRHTRDGVVIIIIIIGLPEFEGCKIGSGNLILRA